MPARACSRCKFPTAKVARFSALKITAVWILQVLVPRPAADGGTETVGSHSGFGGSIVSCTKPIGAANCRGGGAGTI